MGRLSPRTRFGLWKARAMTTITQLVKEIDDPAVRQELEGLLRRIWRAKRRDMFVVVYTVWKIIDQWSAKYPKLKSLVHVVPSEEEMRIFYAELASELGESEEDESEE